MFGPGTLDETHTRRSIYFTIKRSQLMPSMMLFDAPDSLQGLGQRATHDRRPAGPGDVQQPAGAGLRPGAWPSGCWPTSRPTPAEAVDRGYLIALGRPADDVRTGRLGRHSSQQADGFVPGGRQDRRRAELALADFCQVLFGLNEFIYID